MGNAKQIEYDELNRAVKVEKHHFDPVTQLPLGDGYATTQVAYSDASQVVSVTDDNGHTTTIEYDTAGRRKRVTDAKGNTAQYGYDANSNVTQVVQTDKPDLGGADEVYTTVMVYDGLDRLIRRTDPAGNVVDFAYDSRGNLVRNSGTFTHFFFRHHWRAASGLVAPRPRSNPALPRLTNPAGGR